jgi:hypothetical protein
VAEISPRIREAAAHFARWNQDVLHNPRMSLYVLDAREFLLLTNRRYDVIVSEPTNVWVPGVANLFTRDFYKVVRSRLRPGGLFSQWMHVYLADPGMVASVVATVRSEFPFVSAWLVGETDLVLLAGEQRPSLDADAFASRLQALRPTFDMPTPRPERLTLFRDPVLFLALQIGTREGIDFAWPAGSARMYGDRTPRLEFEAARAQFVGAHYPVTGQLDERLTRVGSEPLFLEDYLARHPLDDAGRIRLVESMGHAGKDFRELRATVTADLASRGRDDIQLMMALPEPVLARLIVSRRVGQALDASSVPDPNLCGDYVVLERALLRDARSVFGRPATADFETRMQRCLATSTDGRLSARFARALADAGAAESAVRRITELEQSGSLAQLENKEASDLLVAGSVLLLQRGAYASALPWAQRALALDGDNTAAARIVMALSQRALSLPKVASAAEAHP